MVKRRSAAEWFERRHRGAGNYHTARLGPGCRPTLLPQSEIAARRKLSTTSRPSAIAVYRVVQFGALFLTSGVLIWVTFKSQNSGSVNSQGAQTSQGSSTQGTPMESSRNGTTNSGPTSSGSMNSGSTNSGTVNSGSAGSGSSMTQGPSGSTTGNMNSGTGMQGSMPSTNADDTLLARADRN